MVLQAILFDKDYYTKKEAKKWLSENNYIPIKPVHETSHFYRYRIHKPVFDSYFTKEVSPGIKIVIGYYA